jgi:hypothetical protein
LEIAMNATLADLELPAQLSRWVRNPSIYEINTWVWFSELRDEYGKDIDLASIPSVEWDRIAAYGFDAVWLMGVWERSPAGIAIANQNQQLIQDFRRALPDFRFEDNVGSPYCVHSYIVDENLGGPRGLAVARGELSKRGLKLILDFVPNHVAPDHPWVTDHPEYFIHGSADDIRNDPTSLLRVGGTVFACGRDPYFPAWPDVVQLNAFEPRLRQAAIETVDSIAQQCDGVRCDMAMLFLNSIFERTWGSRSGLRPAKEYWRELISGIKRSHPDFIFVAEAYWDLEWELQQLGFDFCYDKKLYDRLEHGGAETVRLHLCADLAYQSKLLRFLENHDEPRAASIFSLAKQRAFAVTTATLPGAKLFHEGQFLGRKIRVPVFLARRPVEHFDREVHEFYRKLLDAVNQPVFREGNWTLCDRWGWPDNDSFKHLLAWSWDLGEEHFLIVVNLSDSSAQARVQIPWLFMRGTTWQLLDPLSGTTYERSGSEMLSTGLYVELEPSNFHFFQFLRRT